jgi:hypothetical protein
MEINALAFSITSKPYHLSFLIVSANSMKGRIYG